MEIKVFNPPCPHELDPLPPRGHPHTTDIKYTSLSRNS